jgi:23S rRNA (guanosine2251-2'-O)-methyltransferase
MPTMDVTRTARSELLYGYHPVREALLARRRRLSRIVLLAGKGEGRERRAEIALLAQRAGVPVEEMARDALDRFARTDEHQGVAAVADGFAYEDENQLARRLGELPERALVLALDGIQDPHNLGSIIRSANVAGAHAVVIPKDRSAEVTPAVAKASAGAIEYTPVARVTNLVRALETLKEAGLWIVGADPEGDTPFEQLDATDPLVIVVGGEDRGLRALVKRTCDRTVAIPVGGCIASLNASVAAAVILFEAVRQRRVHPGR